MIRFKYSFFSVVGVVVLFASILYVGGNSQANKPPTAAFRITPINPIVEEMFTLDATGSFDSDGDIDSYEWDLGDGFAASGVRVTHLYLEQGAFTITLTVTDDQGASNTLSQTIEVTGKRVMPSEGNQGSGQWEDLGGSLSTAPTVTSLSENRLDVFYQEPSGALVQKTWNGNQWSDVIQVGGGGSTSNIDCVARGETFIECLGRSQNQSLWHKVGTLVGSDMFFGGWDDLGGLLTSGPTAASWGGGRLDVFVSGPANGMFHRGGNGLTFSDWQWLNGLLTSDPDCVGRKFAAIDCFVRGPDDFLFYKTGDGRETWTDWLFLGGKLLSGPTIVSPAPNSLVVFVRGPGETLWQRVGNDNGTTVTWTDWKDMGGAFIDDPDCVARTSEIIDCFAKSSENTLLHRAFTISDL